MLRFYLVLGVAALSATAGQAHYNMLLPESAMVKKGEKVAFVYQWGHPFEHELFDAPMPEKVVVSMPDGKTQDLTKTLEKFTTSGINGKEVDAFRFTFTPKERGDYWFVLKTPPIWMEAEQEFWQDFVQVMLHVETQNGWEKSPPKETLQIKPLTRPYGILPGMAFRAEIAQVYIGATNSSTGEKRFTTFTPKLVEFEHYNATKPKEMPADEFITFKTQLDDWGTYTCSFPDPGWWCMTGGYIGMSTRMHDGKMYPVRQRATLWVHVDAKASASK